MNPEAKTILIWFFGICGAVSVICFGTLLVHWLITRKDAWKTRDPYRAPSHVSRDLNQLPGCIVEMEHEKQLMAYLKETRPDLKPGTPQYFALWDSMWQQWTDELKKKNVKFWKPA